MLNIEELCKQLTAIGRSDKVKRLLELYHIEPKEKEDESNKDLDLNSAKDFVTFLAMIKTDWELLVGMNKLGQISVDWDNPVNGDFFNIKFLGNNQVRCLIYINENSVVYEFCMQDLKNKLLELKLITGLFSFDSEKKVMTEEEKESLRTLINYDFATKEEFTRLL